MQLLAVICGLVGVLSTFRLLSQCEDVRLEHLDEHYAPPTRRPDNDCTPYPKDATTQVTKHAKRRAA